MELKGNGALVPIPTSNVCHLLANACPCGTDMH